MVDPADELPHASGELWHTEGSWWSFHHPERPLAGWVYHLSRPNLGVASGGVWLWDDTTHDPFEVPYFLNVTVQPWAPIAGASRQWTWADGCYVDVIEPLRRAVIGFTGDQRLRFEMTFDAVSTPWVSADGAGRAVRFEQPGVVTGELELDGEVLPIRCVAMRDRSWSVRTEDPGAAVVADPRVDLSQRPVVYGWAMADEATGVLFMGPGGFVFADGHAQRVTDAAQHVERDPRTGHITAFGIELTADGGSRKSAVATPRALIRRPSGSGAAFVYLCEWTIDGRSAWGELQDVWPIGLWSAFRRQRR